VLAVCAGTVGGAACVATGVIPAPLIDQPEHHSAPAAKVVQRPRHLAREQSIAADESYVPETAIEGEAHEATEEAPPEHHESKKPAGEREGGEQTEGASNSQPPPSEGGGTAYVEPAPEPVSEATSSSTSSSASTTSASTSAASPSIAAEQSHGTAAGELGP
jgi:hypothetical protein